MAAATLPEKTLRGDVHETRRVISHIVDYIAAALDNPARPIR